MTRQVAIFPRFFQAGRAFLQCVANMILTGIAFAIRLFYPARVGKHRLRPELCQLDSHAGGFVADWPDSDCGHLVFKVANKREAKTRVFDQNLRRLVLPRGRYRTFSERRITDALPQHIIR